MRILLVCYEYPPLGGGGGVLVQSLAHSLAPHHEVVVLTSGTKQLRSGVEAGVRVQRTGVPARSETQTSSSLSLFGFIPSGLAAARRLVSDWAPDVVHSFFAIPSGPVGAHAARRAKVPHVLTVIGADIHDPTRRFSPDRFRPLAMVVSSVVRSADHLTAISSDIRGRSLSLTGRQQCEVIPCGIELRELPAGDRARLGWLDEDVVILTVSRLVRRKALDALIRSLAALPPQVRLEIVGDGPELPALMQLAETVGRRVHFTRAIPEHERDLRLASADIFALPSLHEGFGIALLEAMWAGLPIVATRAGGPVDFVEDGRHGFLVEPGLEAELVAALSRLVDDVDLRKSLGRNAHRAAEKLSEQAMAQRYMRAYEESLSSFHR